MSQMKISIACFSAPCSTRVRETIALLSAFCYLSGILNTYLKHLYHGALLWQPTCPAPTLSLCLCHARMPRKFRIDFFLMWLIRVWKQQHDTDRQNKLYICFDCCYCIFYTVSNKRNKLPKFRTPDRNPNALSKLFCGSSGLLLIRAKQKREREKVLVRLKVAKHVQNFMNILNYLL